MREDLRAHLRAHRRAPGKDIHEPARHHRPRPERRGGDHPAGDLAARAVALRRDRGRRQPRPAQHQRRQGGRPPVVVGVDGRHHGRAVVPRADQRGPGLGQAARVAGAARDQLPARRPRRGLPADAARQGWPAVLPEPAQGPRHRRLLHRLGGHRRHRRAVGRDLAPLRPLPVRRRAARGPVHQPARRRRARRGRHLGGRRRPAGRPPRGAALGRRPQPPVPGPGGPGHPDRAAAGHVRGGRLAGRDAEVGPADLRALRPARRLRAASPARGDAQRGVPADAPRRLLRGRDEDHGRERYAAAAGAARRGALGPARRRRPRPGRPRPRAARRHLPRRRRPAAERGVRLHRQGSRAADRGTPQQPLRAADRGADAGARRRLRDLARRAVGGVSDRAAPPTTCAVLAAPRCVVRRSPRRPRSASPPRWGTRTASRPRPRPRSAGCSRTSSTTLPRRRPGW